MNYDNMFKKLKLNETCAFVSPNKTYVFKLIECYNTNFNKTERQTNKIFIDEWSNLEKEAQDVKEI